MFHGCTINIVGKDFYTSQKSQGARLEPIDTNKEDHKKAYREQRARGAHGARSAYIATIPSAESHIRFVGGSAA